MAQAKTTRPGMLHKLSGGIIGVAVLLTTAAGLYLLFTMLGAIAPITLP